MLFVIALLSCQPSVPQTVATKALAGDFGKLAPWQEKGYRALLKADPKPQVAWVTQYSQYECSTRTASGRRVESGRTLAMLDVPFGTYVLIDLPAGYTLRQVWDRGSRANIRRARSRGAETWVDVYVSTRSRRILNRSFIRRVWVIGND